MPLFYSFPFPNLWNIHNYIFFSSISVSHVEGMTLNLRKVSRLDMGAYMCIATNGVPPTISKRIQLNVDCKCFLLISTPNSEVKLFASEYQVIASHTYKYYASYKKSYKIMFMSCDVYMEKNSMWIVINTGSSISFRHLSSMIRLEKVIWRTP